MYKETGQINFNNLFLLNATYPESCHFNMQSM